MARWQASIAAFAVSAVMALCLVEAAKADPDPSLVEAAKKEGGVVWASGLIVNQAVRPVAAAFEKKYGIRVEIATADNLLLRMTNEGRAGKPTIDVFDNAGDTITAMRAADLIIPYASPEAERYRPEHKDPEHYWASCCVFYYSTVVNTDMVPPEAEPKTYQDLLDPKWRGKLAWSSNENFAGAPGFIGGTMLSMGDQAGTAYLEKLSKQDVVRIPGNARAVLDQVIMGQYPIAVVALIHHVAISQAQGAPVKWLKLGPLVGTAETVGLVKNAPHPNAAKLLFDFLLSREGQVVLQQANYLPADPGVPAKVPELKPDAGGFTATAILPRMNDEYLPKWLKLYKNLFVGG